jgi:oxalate decarboxylase
LIQWIAGSPVDVPATDFGKPASLFEKFPHDRVFIAPTERPGHGVREIN